MADGGGRTNDADFPSLSIEGETTLGKQLIMNVTVLGATSYLSFVLFLCTSYLHSRHKFVDKYEM
jgi:hypothetical protein